MDLPRTLCSYEDLYSDSEEKQPNSDHSLNSLHSSNSNKYDSTYSDRQVPSMLSSVVTTAKFNSSKSKRESDKSLLKRKREEARFAQKELEREHKRNQKEMISTTDSNTVKDSKKHKSKSSSDKNKRKSHSSDRIYKAHPLDSRDSKKPETKLLQSNSPKHTVKRPREEKLAHDRGSQQLEVESSINIPEKRSRKGDPHSSLEEGEQRSGDEYIADSKWLSYDKDKASPAYHEGRSSDEYKEDESQTGSSHNYSNELVEENTSLTDIQSNRWLDAEDAEALYHKTKTTSDIHSAEGRSDDNVAEGSSARANRSVGRLSRVGSSRNTPIIDSKMGSERTLIRPDGTFSERKQMLTSDRRVHSDDDTDEDMAGYVGSLSDDESDNDQPPPKPFYYPALQGCRSVEEFNCLNRIEEGTYGVVYRAKDTKTGDIVALKRLKMEKERDGFPITSLREINTLMKAQHENIVTLREIVVGSNMDRIYLVMDYVEHDLKALMEVMRQPFLIGEVKCLLAQLLRAVSHLHDNWILHRDLKTSNLLLSHRGILKVGDFGLAREYGSPLKCYTEVVVTLWYRAPELLLGTKKYKCPIDIWSVGCIFGELLLRKPLFQGKNELEQVNILFRTLGKPTELIWPGVGELPLMKKATFPDLPFNNLRKVFGSQISEKGFELMNKLLTYWPEKRFTAEEALKHKYFEEFPRAIDPSMFPTWPAKSEGGIHRRTASPRPPSGGKAKLVDDLGDDSRFHMAAATHGVSSFGHGFNIKF